MKPVVTTMLAGLAVAAALLLGACRSGAGGSCTSTWLGNTCPEGYYCAQVEVCTRTCEAAQECRVACNLDAGQGCAFAEDCIDGVCERSLSAVCQDGYCQGACASTGGCTYDPYGPASRYED